MNNIISDHNYIILVMHTNNALFTQLDAYYELLSEFNKVGTYIRTNDGNNYLSGSELIYLSTKLDLCSVQRLVQNSSFKYRITINITEY